MKHEFSHQICMQQKQIKNGELSNASTYLQIHITIIIILVYIGMYYCRMDVSILHNSTFFIGWLKNQTDLISDALPLFQNGFLTCLLYFLFWRDQTNQGKINCFTIFSQFHPYIPGKAWCPAKAIVILCWDAAGFCKATAAQAVKAESWV